MRAGSYTAAAAKAARSIFAQPDPGSLHEQHARMVEQLEARFPQAATMLADAGPEILAFTAQPKEHWRQIWSNNPLERLRACPRRSRHGRCGCKPSPFGVLGRANMPHIGAPCVLLEFRDHAAAAIAW